MKLSYRSILKAINELDRSILYYGKWICQKTYQTIIIDSKLDHWIENYDVILLQ